MREICHVMPVTESCQSSSSTARVIQEDREKICGTSQSCYAELEQNPQNWRLPAEPVVVQDIVQDAKSKKKEQEERIRLALRKRRKTYKKGKVPGVLASWPSLYAGGLVGSSSTRRTITNPWFLCMLIFAWMHVVLPGVLAVMDPNNPCGHEDAYNVGAVTEMKDGSSVYSELAANYTHRYFYAEYNVTVFNQKDEHRNLIVKLEPCKGVVYLFVRKTRRCFPNPYSCINAQGVAEPKDCEWTHFMSKIDGTRDGAPTFLEFPLTSTKYYISVYAKEKSQYTLTVLSDIGQMPRPGNKGALSARQLAELQIQLSWNMATYFPQGISSTKQYWIYSAMLLDTDKRTNSAIFLSKRKIMNTVCGLQNNTDRPFGDPIPAGNCYGGQCNATVDGVIVGKRYVFNVIAESNSNPSLNMSYSGLILQTDWQVVRQAASPQTLQVVGAVTGSVLGIVIIGYIWIVNLYGK